MSKKYIKRDLEGYLMHTGIICLNIIQQSAKELKELDVSEEEWANKEPSDKTKKGQEILARMNMLNYLIAPYFGLLHQMFPAAHKLIDACVLNYNTAIKDGVFKECDCPGCER